MEIPRKRWLEKAEALKPVLAARRVEPAGWDRGRKMGRRDVMELDFGEHVVGYFRMRFGMRGVCDAPMRVRVVFAERRGDLELPPEPYVAQLSRAWVQDEVVTLDEVEELVRMPRRYAFRYVRLEVVDTSPGYGVVLEEAWCEAVTSGVGTPPPLPKGTPGELVKLDSVAVATLRSCMQTVFEDGPKRDRRLWTGDLRLQAMTNAVTFGNFDLVRRCLYLLGAFCGMNGGVRVDGAGWWGADVYERPKPTAGGCLILDYSVLVGAILLDHLRASGDEETARELFPVAREQIRLAGGFVKEGVLEVPKGWWLFSDWRPGLDQQVPTQGTIVYAARRVAELAEVLGEKDGGALELAEEMTRGARRELLDRGRGMFVSGKARQVSWAGAAWMVLGEVVTGAEAREVLRATFSDPQAVKPAGPYLQHHVVQAMLECGMDREAGELLREYWGSMVAAGADTFDENHDPADPGFSPYGHASLNSRCHAWSCTPAYFIRRYGERLW